MATVKMSVFHALVLVIIGLITYTSAAVIPSYISICHRNDPRVSACIKNSIEELRPRLKEGIPELDVPSLEPLLIDNIIISRGYGNYHFRLNLTDVKVFGASDFELKKLKLDVPNMTYKISLHFPRMRITGNYQVDTRILSLPITSDGQFDANATNVDGTGILKGLVDTKENQQMSFTDLTINLQIDDYKLRLENIVKGDPDLNEAINDLVNSNKEDLIKLSTPFIESRASENILNLANRIVKNFDYDQVFPQ